jgi:DNA-binding transcriptional MerR regulator/effector-binding domain-containing protein
MFTIGEFSRICGLTVKTLRFYHEQDLLVPSFVDPRTGYRHYDRTQVEVARTIAELRKLEFPLAEVQGLLKQRADDDLLRVLEQHKSILAAKVRAYRKAVRSLDQFISQERQAQAVAQSTDEVREKTLDPILVGGIRMKGKYNECGKAFARIGRSLGRHIRGAPFLLHYDEEYKEGDADFEACMPIGWAKAETEISVRELPGGRCVCLPHKGRYEQLGFSYAKILAHVKAKGYSILMPTREVYLKGPGMILKGNPASYLTEIQILIQDPEPKEGDRDEISVA